MKAKGINYTPSERFDILTLMSRNGVVFATKKIAKDKETPKYQDVKVFRTES